jgi:hypothetical protein
MTLCLRGPVRCGERGIVDGGVVAGAAVYGPFCGLDHYYVRRAVDDLADLRLELALNRGTPQQGDGGSTSVYPEIPIREDIDAIERQLDTSVFSWADAIGAEMNLSPVRKFGPAVRRVAAHLETLYEIGPTPVNRWVDAIRVSELPDDTVGVVRASGDALVTIEMTGAQGALEMFKFHTLGCALLKRSPD